MHNFILCGANSHFLQRVYVWFNTFLQRVLYKSTHFHT
nr:MAG TPA: hypothetical protein [Caudoviricetes sp.]